MPVRIVLIDLLSGGAGSADCQNVFGGRSLFIQIGQLFEKIFVLFFVSFSDFVSEIEEVFFDLFGPVLFGGVGAGLYERLRGARLERTAG